MKYRFACAEQYGFEKASPVFQDNYRTAQSFLDQTINNFQSPKGFPPHYTTLHYTILLRQVGASCSATLGCVYRANFLVLVPVGSNVQYDCTVESWRPFWPFGGRATALPAVQSLYPVCQNPKPLSQTKHLFRVQAEQSCRCLDANFLPNQ